jgi:hypothetical protein
VITRTHVWFSAFVVIVLAIGFAAGVATDRSIWHSGRNSGPGGPGGFRGGDRGTPPSTGRDGGGRNGGGRSSDGPPTEAFVRELDTLLTLTADQKATLTGIIDASKPQMRALQDEASKKFADQQQALHDEIVKVLTADQAKKFAETPRGPFGFRWRGGRGGSGGR